jgi:hypothetical protein
VITRLLILSIIIQEIIVLPFILIKKPSTLTKENFLFFVPEIKRFMWRLHQEVAQDKMFLLGILLDQISHAQMKLVQVVFRHVQDYLVDRIQELEIALLLPVILIVPTKELLSVNRVNVRQMLTQVEPTFLVPMFRVRMVTSYVLMVVAKQVVITSLSTVAFPFFRSDVLMVAAGKKWKTVQLVSLVRMASISATPDTASRVQMIVWVLSLVLVLLIPIDVQMEPAKQIHFFVLLASPALSRVRSFVLTVPALPIRVNVVNPWRAFQTAVYLILVLMVHVP